MEVVQVYPMENYDVAVYFVDGNIKKYNVSVWILHEKSRLYYTIKDNHNINIINTQ